MELFSVAIQGFKRFANATMLRTNGKVLALVGPNEAGKTSVLKAIASIGSNDDIAPSDTLDEIGTAGPNLDKSLLGKISMVNEELHRIAERLPKANEIADRWSTLVELEKAPSPQRHAIDTLWSKMPKILFFDEEARNLGSSYSIGALSSGIPLALQSLFSLGEIDFDKVLDAINKGDSAKLTTLEHRANNKLEKAFKTVWRQSGVKVALRLTPAQVDIQIINENSDYTPLAERSDGLRQFVALHAFVSLNRADKPILLIDEAEQRLHYDAQADFVQMLTNQKSASKIIYTTHSAGCLPEDLGHGVRLVHPEENDPTLSKIINKFWATSGGGFSPLLMGMGATTMAFFPTRHAVCVEGAADMLLYPSLLRDVLRKDTLGYQIVPNLSSAARELAPLIPAEASAIAFLVDGDAGGKTLQRTLVEQGIPADRVIVLEDADGNEFEVEDFVDPNLLMTAANRLLERYHPQAKILNLSSMPDRLRMAYLEKAYKDASGEKIPKVDLAYELLEMCDTDPALSLVDPDRRDLLASIGARIEAAIRL